MVTRPETLTGERWEEIKDEAEGLPGTLGHRSFDGHDLTQEELRWLWDHYIYHELGLDACNSCGYWCSDPTTFDEGGNCEDCCDDECE